MAVCSFLAVGLSACGGGGSKPAANLSATTVDQLYEAAKNEASVEVATPIEGPPLDKLQQEFEKKYPGITVKWTRIAGEPDMQRLLSIRGLCRGR